MTTTDDGSRAEQCRALTETGERCSRSARDDGFCYQHDESGRTVDETAVQPAADGGSDERAQGQTGRVLDEATGGDESDETEGDADRTDESPGEMSETDEPPDETGEAVERVDSGDSGEESASDESGRSGDSSGDAGSDRSTGQPLSTESDRDDVPDIVAVRRAVQNTTEALIGRPLDGVLEVSPEDDGWRVLVEVVERAAVPDTQDILGKYEIEVTDDLDVRGYRRLERYRRSDTGQSQ